MTDVVNRKRADGSGTRIVEALLADATGCILMSARNEKGERPAPLPLAPAGWFGSGD